MKRFELDVLPRRYAITTVFLALLTTSICATAYAAAGDPAKLEGSLIDGKKYSLEAQHGKVVLVVFWATWCPICRRELPKLEKFYRENAAKNFEVVAVSVDDSPEKVRGFLAKNPLSFPVGWRNRFKDNLGRVDGTPTFVLVDRQGVIRARTEGALDDGEWWAIEDEIAKRVEACNDSVWTWPPRYRAL